ncbi:MAG: aminotransferase class V-fold PLP-dependent enzyme, partial [Candidatus Eremiobacteraeota bacterium]|nr:aminotransferase class V-fold PLP-dependent enzyme [Candidatus Eremiobacteraeota bacterium]
MNARIYADHAATTPLRPEVLEAMLPYLSDSFNASSVHEEGRRARRVLDDSRAAIARLLGAQPREIVFTSGGSEADNLAIFGMAQALAARGRHIVTSAIEHHAVLHATERLRDEGWDITTLAVDRNGFI